MINPLITKALKESGLPVYYVNRGENPTPCVVFTIIESPGSFSDDVEDLTEYTILLNLYISPEEYVKKFNLIGELMTKAGFIKRNIPSARWEETLNVFNQPMEYKIYK